MVTTAEQKQNTPPVRTYLPIEDYGIIGDLHTVALVGKNGSIDWYCVPAFDAPSVFGALLDSEKGGYFQIEPRETPVESYKQHYLPDTNILVTRFLTESGVGEVTDFMPIQQATSPTDRHGIVRAVHVVNGSLSFEMTCRPAFNYARDSQTVEPVERGMVFRSPNLMLGLFSTVPVQAYGQGGARASFTLGEDEWAYFAPRSAEAPEVTTPEQVAAMFQKVLADTKDYWRNWLKQCRYQGRWREMVYRSALALKLLTYAPTGAVVAAPTTSLPEGIGGERNWHYRFTWLRDAGLTLQSSPCWASTRKPMPSPTGCWRVCPTQARSTHPTHVHHSRGDGVAEIFLDHLDGYRQSRPVRIGNGAANSCRWMSLGNCSMRCSC